MCCFPVIKESTETMNCIFYETENNKKKGISNILKNYYYSFLYISPKQNTLLEILFVSEGKTKGDRGRYAN
jgi:hypothetical protein